jgi:hypothetical protein
VVTEPLSEDSENVYSGEIGRTKVEAMYDGDNMQENDDNPC